jgi:hypothetical protein
MRVFFVEVLHKLLVAIVGVAAGMTAWWYADTHGQNRWIVGAVAVGATLVIGLLFHPFVWIFRHRPRRRYVTQEPLPGE